MDRRLPTLTDVARHVAEKSARRVREAIAELGYVRNVAAANLSQGRTYRFAAVIPGGTNTFFQRIRTLLEAERDALRMDRVVLSVTEIAAFDAAALVAAMEAAAEGGIDGVMIVGTDDAAVTEAVARLRGAGIAVVTLVSDLTEAAHDGYVGIDNVVAGQTAGRLIGLPHGGGAGRVLPVLGALSAHDHTDRLSGLREVIGARYPRLEIAPQIEGRDRAGLVERAVQDALEADPAITAIYNAGAGNAGLIRALEGLAGPRPVVVLHELTPHSRAALEAGRVDVVIDQRPEIEIAQALVRLRQLADRGRPPPPVPVVPALYVAENLPPPSGQPEKDPTP